MGGEVKQVYIYFKSIIVRLNEALYVIKYRENSGASPILADTMTLLM